MTTTRIGGGGRGVRPEGPGPMEAEDEPGASDQSLGRRMGVALAVSLGVNILLFQGAALMAHSSVARAAEPAKETSNITFQKPAVDPTPAAPAPTPTPTPPVHHERQRVIHHRVHIKEPAPTPIPVPEPHEKLPSKLPAKTAAPAGASPAAPATFTPKERPAPASPGHSVELPAMPAPAKSSDSPASPRSSQSPAINDVMKTFSATPTVALPGAGPARPMAGPSIRSHSPMAESGRNRVIVSLREHSSAPPTFTAPAAGALRPGQAAGSQGGLRNSNAAAASSAGYGAFAPTETPGVGGGAPASAHSAGPGSGHGPRRGPHGPIAGSMGDVRPGTGTGPAAGASGEAGGAGDSAGKHHAGIRGGQNGLGIDGSGTGAVQDGSGPAISTDGSTTHPGSSLQSGTGPGTGASGSVSTTRSAEILDRASPETPDSLRATPYDVTVTVRIRISGGGQSRGEIVKGSGFPDLDAAVLAAVRHYKVSPALQSGRAVDAAITEKIHLVNR